MREMKDSGISWIGEIPKDWKITQARRLFNKKKEVVGDAVDQYERLALTLNGVIKRSKEDSEGLQPEKFEGYQILRKNNLVFKMIDLENVNTSRVGLSPYTGLVSPAYIVFSNNRDDNRYPYYWFMSMYYHEVFNHLGGDGVRSALNAKDMLSLPIPNISETEQACIADYLDEKCAKIDAIIEKQQEIIEKLKEYKLSVITETVTKGLNPNVEMKDSGNEFLGEIPSRWQCLKVKNIASLVTDGAHISPETENGIYDFVSTVNLEQDCIHYEKSLKTSEESYKYLVNTGCKPQMNDVLISKDGSVGRTAVVTEDREFVVSSSLVIIRPISDVILSEFLNYNLQAKFVQDTLLMLMHGAGLRRVSVEKNSNLPVVLPPIQEQKRIVSYLNDKCQRISEMINIRQRLNDKLKNYKKSLIYEVVTGKREV